LTGKYRDGVPPGSRGTVESYAFLRKRLTDPARNERVGQLQAVAKDLGCSVAQLALAWCLKNPRVSTVITGASQAAQVVENMKAIDVAGKIDSAVRQRIDAIIGDDYT
jgi:aryl-alcohol dehydrogenase-like predicted oxidoreductase